MGVLQEGKGRAMFNDIQKYVEFRNQMLGAMPGQPAPPDGSKGNAVNSASSDSGAANYGQKVLGMPDGHVPLQCSCRPQEAPAPVVKRQARHEGCQSLAIWFTATRGLHAPYFSYR